MAESCCRRNINSKTADLTIFRHVATNVAHQLAWTQPKKQVMEMMETTVRLGATYLNITKFSITQTPVAAASRKRGKRRKKCQWSDNDLDDFVDIVVNDENHRRKLIFQNTMSKANKANYESICKELKSRAKKRGCVFDKSITQMRNKFKKLVSECEKVSMIFKTATGISEYKDEKNYSKWFDMLFPLIKSRESCQPEQAMEPSAGPSTSDKESGINVLDEDQDESETSKLQMKNYLSLRPKKKNKKSDNLLVEKSTEVLESVKSLLQNQQTSTFLEFMENENARARAHELEILKTLIPSLQNQVQDHFNIPPGSVAQGGHLYRPVNAVPQAGLSFGQCTSRPNDIPHNSFTMNPVGVSIPSNISVGPISNSNTAYSQLSENPALNETTNYFKL